MQSVIFVTMVRGDHAMLAKWVAHHERLVPTRKSLLVATHGHDPKLDRIVRGCSTMMLPFDEQGQGFEHNRRNLFFGLARALKGYYRQVVTLDCDEFLVLDPEVGEDLGAYLDDKTFKGVALSPTGFDVTHRPSVETEPLDLSRPVLRQRSHGFLDAIYSKPCIFRDAPPAGGTQHRLFRQPWDIDPNLLLFHLRYFDTDFASWVSRRRMQTAEDFQAHGDSHGIGTWKERLTQMQSRIDMLEQDAPDEFTRDEVSRFGKWQMSMSERREGRLNWKRAHSKGKCIPERFLDLV